MMPSPPKAVQPAGRRRPQPGSIETGAPPDTMAETQVRPFGFSESRRSSGEREVATGDETVSS